MLWERKTVRQNVYLWVCIMDSVWERVVMWGRRQRERDDSVWVCAWVKKMLRNCLTVYVKERERIGLCEQERGRERKKEKYIIVCMCVWKRERGKYILEWEREKGGDRKREAPSIYNDKHKNVELASMMMVDAVWRWVMILHHATLI